MQHERVDVRSQFGNDKWNPLRHQPADEMYVTAQPVQLGDDDRTLVPLGLGQRGGELRPTLQRVGPLAGLDLGKFGRDGKALAAGELRVRRTLCLKAKAGTA